MKRRAELKRTSGLRRTGRPRARRKDRPHADPGFQSEVIDAHCLRCHRRGCAGHHGLAQQHLRDYVRSLRLPPDEAWELEAQLLSDRRNRVPLCPDCHDKHEYEPGGRLPRTFLPTSVWVFARELGTWAVVRLEGDYPA